VTKTIVLKGRGAIGGIAEGNALCCPNSIQGWAGIDPNTGHILEKGHIHEGEGYDGKILVVPCSKGSCGWSCQFHGPLDNAGIRPAGWVVTKIDSKIGVAAVIINRPMVADFTDLDPIEVIEDGDHVVVNGDEGTVTVTKPEK
jgi:predicted aconitase with swiveling domain